MRRDGKTDDRDSRIWNKTKRGKLDTELTVRKNNLHENVQSEGEKSIPFCHQYPHPHLRFPPPAIIVSLSPCPPMRHLVVTLLVFLMYYCYFRRAPPLALLLAAYILPISRGTRYSSPLPVGAILPRTSPPTQSLYDPVVPRNTALFRCRWQQHGCLDSKR